MSGCWDFSQASRLAVLKGANGSRSTLKAGSGRGLRFSADIGERKSMPTERDCQHSQIAALQTEIQPERSPSETSMVTECRAPNSENLPYFPSGAQLSSSHPPFQLSSGKRGSATPNQHISRAERKDFSKLRCTGTNKQETQQGWAVAEVVQLTRSAKQAQCHQGRNTLS